MQTEALSGRVVVAAQRADQAGIQLERTGIQIDQLPVLCIKLQLQIQDLQIAADPGAIALYRKVKRGPGGDHRRALLFAPGPGGAD